MKKHRSKVKKTEHPMAKEALDVPRLLNPNLFHMEMQGNEEVIIDGCAGVLDYNEQEIVLKADTLRLVFRGDALRLCSFTEEEVVIEGTLTDIAFEK